MRVPSIHITRLDLEAILGDLGHIDSSNIDEFMSLARRVAITKRSVVATNQKQRKTLKKVVESSTGDANLLSDILYAARVKMKHVGVTKIRQADQQWPSIKELVPVINAYCEANNVPVREGYVDYITTGLELMKEVKRINYNFAAKWMTQRADFIIDTLKGKSQVKHDPTPKDTIDIHDTYVTMVADRTGIYKFYTKDPATMFYFVQAKDQANSVGVDYNTYIEAQFYALEFCNGIPRPQDLAGDKASDRLISYISKVGTSIASPASKVVVDWGKFKH